jgi:hypothetical protein
MFTLKTSASFIAITRNYKYWIAVFVCFFNFNFNIITFGSDLHFYQDDLYHSYTSNSIQEKFEYTKRGKEKPYIEGQDNAMTKTKRNW